MENRNRQVLLKRRPSGGPTTADFEIVDGPIPEPGSGEVLVRGICGELTGEMVMRFRADVLADKPAWVLILGGTNDLGCNAAPAEIMRYAVEKGSVCVAGVGLTITGLDETGFSVSLVPHTLDVTTLGGLEPGDRVNLEADVLAKYVEKLAFPGALLRSDPIA